MLQKEHVTLYWKIQIEILNDTCESEDPRIENLCDELLCDLQDIRDKFNNHDIMTVKVIE